MKGWNQMKKKTMMVLVLVIMAIFAFVPTAVHASAACDNIVASYDLDGDGLLTENDFEIMKSELMQNDKSSRLYRVSDLVLIKKEIDSSISVKDFTMSGQVSDSNMWYIRNTFANCEVKTITVTKEKSGQVKFSLSGENFDMVMLFRVVATAPVNAEKIYSISVDEQLYNVWKTPEFFVVEEEPKLIPAICAYKVSSGLKVSEQNTEMLKNIFSEQLRKVETDGGNLSLQFENEDVITELIFNYCDSDENGKISPMLASAQLGEVTVQLYTDGSQYWIGMVA